MPSKVYINGRVVARADAKISVFDSGLCFGYGLFETIKSDRGELILLNEHIARLKKGARELGIKTPSKKDLKKTCLDLLATNKHLKKTARLKIMITAGELSSDKKTTPRPTIIITTQGVDTRALKERLEKGISAVTLRPPEFALREPSTAHIKNLNYLPSVLGRAYATKHRAFEGIFIDEKGRVLEGTASNIFIVKNSKIKTPPLCAVLPGVTRAAVIGLSGLTQNIKEATVTERALFGADEAFITGAVSGIVPLIMIDSKKIGIGKPGAVTRTIQDKYEKLFKTP